MTHFTRRTVRVAGDVAYVPLTGGFEAIVDAEDAGLVGRWNWCAQVKARTVYAMRGSRINGKNVTVRLHRMIIEAPNGVQVDHINGNGLDNRKANLRFATTSENSQNARRRQDNISGFKGVYWDRHWKRWKAQIRYDGKCKRLGTFSTPEEAHQAYCRAAKDLHGSFANDGMAEALATFNKEHLDSVAVEDPGTAYTQWQSKERAA